MINKMNKIFAKKSVDLAKNDEIMNYNISEMEMQYIFRKVKLFYNFCFLSLMKMAMEALVKMN